MRPYHVENRQRPVSQLKHISISLGALIDVLDELVVPQVRGCNWKRDWRPKRAMFNLNDFSMLSGQIYCGSHITVSIHKYFPGCNSLANEQTRTESWQKVTPAISKHWICMYIFLERNTTHLFHFRTVKNSFLWPRFVKIMNSEYWRRRIWWRDVTIANNGKCVIPLFTNIMSSLDLAVWVSRISGERRFPMAEYTPYNRD